jgi:hypothetical protein
VRFEQTTPFQGVLLNRLGSQLEKVNSMNEYIQVDPSYQARRWITYLDLLGFTELINTKGWIYIFSYYKQAIEYCTKEYASESTIEKAWFSDTFLLYSPDDTALSFTAIEATTRWFVYFLVSNGIPVRGAISCADLYADKENNLFFGKALLEAYHYGENQNWIGFVLTPSCVEQMAAIGLPADQRLDYAYWNIPYINPDKTLVERLPACILGGSVGNNACLDELYKMKTRIGNSYQITKYENTISFIEANKKQVVEC